MKVPYLEFLVSVHKTLQRVKRSGRSLTLTQADRDVFKIIPFDEIPFNLTLPEEPEEVTDRAMVGIRSSATKEPVDQEVLARQLNRIMGRRVLTVGRREKMAEYLRIAEDRQIIAMADGRVWLHSDDIRKYGKEVLDKEVLAALGLRWMTQAQVAAAVARRLGFQSVGSNIREEMRKTLNRLQTSRKWLIKEDGYFRIASEF